MEANYITNQELEELLDSEEKHFLFDVREKWEYELGHIPGARWMPMDMVQECCPHWPSEFSFVIICNTVNRSKAICRYLSRRGFDNVRYALPGMEDWQGPITRVVENPGNTGRTEPTKVYLDNAATTRVEPRVADAVLDGLLVNYGNPSSAHTLGRFAKEKLTMSRFQTAALINADVSEIVFTSGGTEANNAAIWGILQALPKERRSFYTSQVEHPAVLRQVEFLRENGVEVHVLPVDSGGRVSPTDLDRALTKNSGLVSIMLVNNEVGTVQPIGELCDIAHHYGAFFHTDAIQAVSTMQVNVQDLGVDALSISGHKIGAPKGTGALFLKKGIPCRPLIRGGGQELGRRAGTENIPGIIGLGLAAQLAKGRIADVYQLRRLRDRLEKDLLALAGVCVYGREHERSPAHLCFSVQGYRGHDLVLDFDLEGIACSSGSACSAKNEGSHVLRAMGFGEEEAIRAVRMSLGWHNTEEEIAYVAEVIRNIVTGK